jgi:hypothetical protein
MKSNNDNPFVYSSYWGTWSRLLLSRSKGTEELFTKYGVPDYVHEVEVDCGAVNPQFKDGWKIVQDVNIRAHCTSRGKKDTISINLPDEAYWTLVRNVQDDLQVYKILHLDLLPIIDWDLYRKNDNGGCPISKCTKGVIK